jgi:hypothetical protein
MRHIQTITLVAGLLWAAAAPQARQVEPVRPPTPSAPRAPQPARGSQQSFDPAPFIDEQNAQETRERLRRILDQYPPSLREVLRFDNSLLSNPQYLSPYPALAAFLAQHPEVAHNAAWFIGEPEFRREQSNDPRVRMLNMIEHLAQFAAVVIGIMTVTFGLVWVIRSLLEQRRWTRAMRAQGDLQTKLIDRFSSSDELLAYLQSPAGKALREMPVITATASRGMDAPLSRIFWSLQAGAVLAAAGAGMLFVSDREPLLGPPLFAIGTVVLTIGIGFIASAAISYFLSQRLGLVSTMSTRYGGEAPGP